MVVFREGNLEMFLNKDNICEIWEARKGLVIPPGTVAYHLQLHREYRASSKLKARDGRGDLLVCLKQFPVQLKKVRVMLRRGDSGPCVHLTWCSLEFGIINLAEISTQLDSVKSPLSFDEFEEKLKPCVSEALQSFEKYDLTSENGQKIFESQAPDQINVMLGLKAQKCILRRILTEQDYFEEEKHWADFILRMQRLMNDRRIAEATEENRLEEALSELETERIRSLLTKEEKNLAVIKRLSKYIELLLPTRVERAAEVSEPCPYPNCRFDLSRGQTFVCEHRGHNVRMHAWHKSSKKPEWCDQCYERFSRRRKRLVAAALVILLVIGGLFGLRVYSQKLHQKYCDPLALHWYGFGQRLENGAWHEFRVQDGVTMYSGDQFRIAFLPNADSYVYILCLNADGSVNQLFPNPAVRQGNFCRRGQEYQVPDGINWFTLDEKTGTETMFLVASYDPLTNLSALLKKASRGQNVNKAGEVIWQQIKQVELKNQPDEHGTVRTRSGIIVRNVEIRPDQKVAQAKLSSGEYIERIMEVVEGKTSAVKRIQFTHLRGKGGSR